MLMLKTKYSLLLLLLTCGCSTSYPQVKLVNQADIRTGAQQTEMWMQAVRDKKLALVVNQSSRVNDLHLIDLLLNEGLEVIKIFTPEHGLTGQADAGASISSGLYKPGLPIVSLYGNKKKPSAADMEGIDMVVFDLQDVGVRFYTYISTLTYIMQVCAEYNIPLMVLDRPNPNGFYVDGPVLEAPFRSFVGLHPVPVVYGLTIGEYALMVNGEGWLENKKKCDLKVIPLEGYTHQMLVKLQQPPSPNLKSWESVYLYPSLCFFEGTIVSVGRGTDEPFVVYGHPELHSWSYEFIPEPKPGASDPKLRGMRCKGENLKQFAQNYGQHPPKIHLKWLLEAHHELRNNQDFFNNYFDKLAGNTTLRQQIVGGQNEDLIRQSWEEGLNRYKKIRAKYLLYPDFE